jgi:Dynamin family
MQNAEYCSTDPVGLNCGAECLQSGAHTQQWASFAKRLDCAVEQLRAVDSKLAAELKKSLDQLVRTKVTVTFGGRFKAGKSMLVNKLLEREILPVNIEAETGAPCFVHAAAQDRATAMRDMHLLEFPATTEALREQLSLWRRCIGESKMDLAARVNLELTGVPIPENVQWVDTPGVDDSAEMDAVSLKVFQRTDVLIWVLSSESALSLEEKRYISDHVERAGPRGTVFLTNVFIRDACTYEESWRAFVEKQLPVLCSRISHAAESMGFNGHAPRMLAVCGAAMGEVQNGEYGSGAVKELVQSIRSKEHNMVAACRLRRVWLALNETTEAIERAREREADENERTEKEWRRRKQAYSARRAAFEREVDAALEYLMTELRSETKAAARSVAAGVYQSNIQRGHTYSIRLDKEINEGLQKVTREYAKEVRAAAQRSSVTCLSDGLLQLVRGQIPAPNCLASVPDTPAKLGSAAGVAAGGILASVFTFGLLAPAAVATAAAMAKREADKALAADVEGARSNIHAEAEKYHKQSSTWKSKVRHATLDAFEIVEPALERPDRQREHVLGRLVEELRGLGLEAERLATDAN